jgi:hypothetical protein
MNKGPCTDFQLRVGKYGKNQNSRRINCLRGRATRTSRGSKEKTSTTQLPTTASETCKFSFTINKDPDLQRWYIRKNNNNCWIHCGHTRLPRDLQYDTVRQVPEDTLKTAQDLLSQLIPVSIVGQYIETESLKALRFTVLKNKHGTSINSNESTAVKLINILENTAGMSYVTYTGETIVVVKVFSETETETASR